MIDIFVWQIDNYLNKEWSGKKLIDEKPQELSVLTFVPQGGTNADAMVSGHTFIF